MFISLFAFIPFRVQRNEPKKRQPFTRRFTAGHDLRDFPALPAKSRRLGKSDPCRVLRRVVFLLLALLHGCVKWQKQENLLFVLFKNPEGAQII